MTINSTAARLGGSATAANNHNLVVNYTTINEFLTTLRTHDPNGLLEFRSFCNGDDGRLKQVDRFWTADVTDAVERVTQPARQGRHCFVGIAARSQSGAGDKASLIHIDWLWCDLDFNKLPGGELEACERIKSYARQPQMIVATGGGFHVYYRIQRTMLPKFQSDVETALKQLTADLGGDRAACDTARILRLPGTWNTKPEYNEARSVRFVLSELCAPGKTYHLTEFYTPQLSSPPKPQNNRPIPFGTGVSGDATDILSRALQSSRGPKIRSLMSGDTTGYRSSSEADQALCAMLVFWCGPNGQADIDNIFRMSGLFRPEKWDATHASDGRTYGELTIERAYNGRTDFYDDGYAASITRLRQTLPEDVTDDLTTEADPEIAQRAAEVSAGAEAVSGPVAPDMSADTPRENPKPLHTTPGETLAAAGLQLDGRLKRLGVKLFPCGLFMPGTIDREDLEKVGRALQQGERAQIIVERFLWADWYNGLPKVRGARTYIVRQIFGDNAPRKLQGFSEWATTARRIPQEMRKAARPWSFYEKVARLHDDRRDYWLSAEPVPGMMAILDEELQATRKPLEIPETSRQIGRNNFGNSEVTALDPDTSPQSIIHVYDEGDEETASTLPNIPDVSVRTDEPASLRPDTVRRLQAWADAHGIDVSDPSDIVYALLKEQERRSTVVPVPDPLAGYDELISAAQAGCLPCGGTYHLSRCEVYNDLNVAVLMAVAKVLRPYGCGSASAWTDLLDRVQALVADHVTPTEEIITEVDPFADQEVSEPEPTLEALSVPIRVELTDAQLAEAAQVAAWRKGGHDHCRRASEDAGGDAVNLDRDLWGARAEIGVRDFLRQQGLEPQGWEMTGHRTPKGSDFKLNGTLFDVKAVPKRHACVNEQQRQQGKADRFLFAIFESDRTFTLSEPIHRDEVSRWQLMTNRHSPYRSIDQQTLPRLYDVRRLR